MKHAANSTPSDSRASLSKGPSPRKGFHSNGLIKGLEGHISHPMGGWQRSYDSIRWPTKRPAWLGIGSPAAPSTSNSLMKNASDNRHSDPSADGEESRSENRGLARFLVVSVSRRADGLLGMTACVYFSSAHQENRIG